MRQLAMNARLGGKGLLLHLCLLRWGAVAGWREKLEMDGWGGGWGPGVAGTAWEAVDAKARWSGATTGRSCWCLAEGGVAVQAKDGGNGAAKSLS